MTILHFDHAALARARKVRFIIEALFEHCRKNEPKREAAALPIVRNLVGTDKSYGLTLDGIEETKKLLESVARELSGVKSKERASDTTWALVLSELEARASQFKESVK